jgi:hypothetical protein
MSVFITIDILSDCRFNKCIVLHLFNNHWIQKCIIIIRRETNETTLTTIKAGNFNIFIIFFLLFKYYTQFHNKIYIIQIVWNSLFMRPQYLHGNYLEQMITIIALPKIKFSNIIYFNFN